MIIHALLWYFGIGIAARLISLAAGEYPIKVERQPWQDVVGLIFAIYVFVCLYGMR